MERYLGRPEMRNECHYTKVPMPEEDPDIKTPQALVFMYATHERAMEPYGELCEHLMASFFSSDALGG